MKTVSSKSRMTMLKNLTGRPIDPVNLLRLELMLSGWPAAEVQRGVFRGGEAGLHEVSFAGHYRRCVHCGALGVQSYTEGCIRDLPPLEVPCNET